MYIFGERMAIWPQLKNSQPRKPSQQKPVKNYIKPLKPTADKIKVEEEAHKNNS